MQGLAGFFGRNPSRPTSNRSSGKTSEKAGSRPTTKRSIRARLIRWTRAFVLAVIGVHVLLAALFVVLRYVNPPTTGVQMQRRVASWFGGDANGKGYTKHETFVPLSKISPNLQHAVISAEDGRFYQHHGVDYEELDKVLHEQRPGKQLRGASTLTQQLVKNLFFTTHRNPVRKLTEYTLAPLADFILGKQRVLELYLNEVEWGRGIYGAEAAARHYYGIPASQLTRDQAARLAAILPDPRRRSPAKMNSYSAIIEQRMQLQGW